MGKNLPKKLCSTENLLDRREQSHSLCDFDLLETCVWIGNRLALFVDLVEKEEFLFYHLLNGQLGVERLGGTDNMSFLYLITLSLKQRNVLVRVWSVCRMKFGVFVVVLRLSFHGKRKPRVGVNRVKRYWRKRKYVTKEKEKKKTTPYSNASFEPFATQYLENLLRIWRECCFSSVLERWVSEFLILRVRLGKVRLG